MTLIYMLREHTGMSVTRNDIKPLAFTVYQKSVCGENCHILGLG
jgi:hypothetical protein